MEAQTDLTEAEALAEFDADKYTAELDRAEAEREAEAQTRPVESDADKRQLMKSNPAVRKPGWIPRGLWPDLDARAERHEEALSRLDAVLADAAQQGQRFRDEDEERIEAYKTGLKAPKMTDPAKREQVIREARAKVEAAQRNLTDAVVEAVRTIQEREDEWLRDLAEREAEAEAKRREAARLLAEARRKVAEMMPTRHWISRTARNQPRDHISIGTLGVPEPEPTAEESQLLEMITGGVDTAN